jgi:hypothetical protein
VKNADRSFETNCPNEEKSIIRVLHVSTHNCRTPFRSGKVPPDAGRTGTGAVFFCPAILILQRWTRAVFARQNADVLNYFGCGWRTFTVLIFVPGFFKWSGIKKNRRSSTEHHTQMGKTKTTTERFFSTKK